MVSTLPPECRKLQINKGYKIKDIIIICIIFISIIITPILMIFFIGRDDNKDKSSDNVKNKSQSDIEIKQKKINENEEKLNKKYELLLKHKTDLNSHYESLLKQKYKTMEARQNYLDYNKQILNSYHEIISIDDHNNNFKSEVKEKYYWEIKLIIRNFVLEYNTINDENKKRKILKTIEQLLLLKDQKQLFNHDQISEIMEFVYKYQYCNFTINNNMNGSVITLDIKTENILQTYTIKKKYENNNHKFDIDKLEEHKKYVHLIEDMLPEKDKQLHYVVQYFNKFIYTFIEQYNNMINSNKKYQEKKSTDDNLNKYTTLKNLIPKHIELAIETNFNNDKINNIFYINNLFYIKLDTLKSSNSFIMNTLKKQLFYSQCTLQILKILQSAKKEHPETLKNISEIAYKKIRDIELPTVTKKIVSYFTKNKIEDWLLFSKDTIDKEIQILEQKIQTLEKFIKHDKFVWIFKTWKKNKQLEPIELMKNIKKIEQEIEKKQKEIEKKEQEIKQFELTKIIKNIETIAQETEKKQKEIEKKQKEIEKLTYINSLVNNQNTYKLLLEIIKITDDADINQVIELISNDELIELLNK